MLDITADQRRALRARAHALNPVVAISQNGLSDSVMQEISTSLVSHELIKIRVFSDERDLRAVERNVRAIWDAVANAARIATAAASACTRCSNQPNTLGPPPEMLAPSAP